MYFQKLFSPLFLWLLLSCFAFSGLEGNSQVLQPDLEAHPIPEHLDPIPADVSQENQEVPGEHPTSTLPPSEAEQCLAVAEPLASAIESDTQEKTIQTQEVILLPQEGSEPTQAEEPMLEIPEAILPPQENPNLLTEEQALVPPTTELPAATHNLEPVSSPQPSEDLKSTPVAETVSQPALQETSPTPEIENPEELFWMRVLNRLSDFLDWLWKGLVAIDDWIDAMIQKLFFSFK